MELVFQPHFRWMKAFLSYTWWCHQMETFPRYWLFVWGNHRSPVNSPYQGQERGALIFSLICAWTNVWVNNQEAGDRDAIALIMASLWWGCLFLLCRMNKTCLLSSSALNPEIYGGDIECTQTDWEYYRRLRCQGKKQREATEEWVTLHSGISLLPDM